MLVYRLGSRRYPANDGVGASHYGGRWNYKGTPMVYAAASRALCALEVLANADELPSDYVVTPMEIPGDLAVSSRSMETLSLHWDAIEPTEERRRLGTEWANSLESAVLVVPPQLLLASTIIY